MTTPAYQLKQEKANEKATGYQSVRTQSNCSRVNLGKPTQAGCGWEPTPTARSVANSGRESSPTSNTTIAVGLVKGD